MDDIIFFVLTFYGFIFLCFTTTITWLLSKKIPTGWFYNKVVAGIFLAFTVPCVLGIVAQHYLDSLPTGKFAKNVGFYPTSQIKDLQVISEHSGDHTQNNFIFSTDKDTFKKILGKCFYEIPKAEYIERSSSPETPSYKEFLEKEKVRYYEKLARDVEETGCLGDFSDSYVAYDEETGKTYFQWNWNDF